MAMRRLHPAGAGQESRRLGPFDATCVVIGAIVGVGIFFTPSQVAAQAGSVAMAMVAWGVGGMVALCGALTFAELGSRYHANGAQYTVLRDAFGGWVGFVFVFCNATAVQAGAMGIIALVCIAHLNAVVTAETWSAPVVMGLAACLIALLTLANVAGVQWGSRIQNLSVIAKMAALGLVVALGMFAVPAGGGTAKSESMTTHPTLLGFLAAIVPTIFAYGGWQHALWLAGEVRNPARVIPRAILIGVGIVIATYLAANWAYFQLLSLPEVIESRTLAADAVSKSTWLASSGRWWIALAVSVSAFGVLNAQLLSGPRLIQGMARDGRFFSWFAGRADRPETPWTAIALLGALAVALLFTAGKDGLGRLTTGVVFVDGTFFALTGFALILIRQRTPITAEPYRFRSPLYPWPTLLFAVGMLGVIVGSFADPEFRSASFIGGAWIAASVVIYLVAFRKSVPLDEADGNQQNNRAQRGGDQ